MSFDCRKLVVPLWCCIWIGIVCIGTYFITSGIPEIKDYSYFHFGNAFLLPKLITLFNTLAITSICIAHKYIERLVLEFAPQVQMMVKDNEEYSDDDDEYTE